MSSAPVYLDYAATTPVRPEVREAMLPYLGGEVFGNPSSGHRFGRAARAGLEQARHEVAEALGVAGEEVFFTSGGTEADNWAILGPSQAARTAGRPRLAVVAATEHKAVLAAAHEVRHQGGGERLLPVSGSGLLDLGALDAALGEHPTVVSVMWVNNETGVIQPIAEIAARCRAARVPFHSDLVQAFGKLPLDLHRLPLTLATITAHKIGGPKGVGALVVRDPDLLEPILHGGGQQRGLRPGTENIAGIVGLGRAARLAALEQAEAAARLLALRENLAERLRDAVPDLVITGEAAPRAPHVLNVQVPGTDSAALLAQLDLAGVAASGGSACTTGAIEPSHVLTAMGVAPDLALGAIRFSLGRESTTADVFRAAELFPQVVARARTLAGALGRSGGRA
jgi:cysteine desulfurase